jgi:hypothetical protein
VENVGNIRGFIILTREIYPRVGRIRTRFNSGTVNPTATVYATLLETSVVEREASDIRHPSNGASSAISSKHSRHAISGSTRRQ